jgi:hypothetical protein
VAGPDEYVAVYKLDRRQSAKFCDGSSAVTETFTDFETDLASFDTSVGARKRKTSGVPDNQSELPLTASAAGGQTAAA